MEVLSMDNHPVKKETHDIVEKNSEGNWPTLPFSPFQNMFPFPFIHFTFSQTQVSTDGRTTEIRSEEHRYEKGQLQSRRFEGSVAGDIFSSYSQIFEQQMAIDRKSTRLNSSHNSESRMPSSA
jgi:hypothetical protein